MKLTNKLICACLIPACAWIAGFISYPWSVVISISGLMIAFRTHKKPLPPLYDGTVSPGWEQVEDTYRQLIESGQELGSAFAVYHEGKLVVDLWGGYSDVEAERPWSRDTLACMWSCTKGMCAIAMADLNDRGLIDYNEPVATYWPEFRQNGKENITIKTLLSHQAGLIIMDEPYRVALTSENPEELGRILAKQTPNWKAGSGHGYHSITFGLYVDQIVRRVDPKQRGMKDYFQQEICEKVGAEYHIGLNLDQTHRFARIRTADFGYMYILLTAIPALIGLIKLVIKSLFVGNDYLMRHSNVADWKVHSGHYYDVKTVNNIEFRMHPIGSSHGFSSARDIARIYSAVIDGDKMLGKNLLKPETVELLNTAIASGPDKMLMVDASYGPGVMQFPINDALGHQASVEYSGFGHPGLGGQIAVCDPEHHLTWGYCTNQMNHLANAFLDHRFKALQDAMFDCLTEINKNKDATS